jgi:hypothetical protein
VSEGSLAQYRLSMRMAVLKLLQPSRRMNNFSYKRATFLLTTGIRLTNLSTVQAGVRRVKVSEGSLAQYRLRMRMAVLRLRR